MELSMMTFMMEFPVLYFMDGSKEDKSEKIQEAIRLTARTGYKRIDLIFQTIQLVGRENIRRMLQENGLSLNCIICMDLAADADRVPELVETAESLGCKKLMLVPGKMEGTRQQMFGRLVDVFSRAVSEAEKRGMVCVVEDDPDIGIPMATREEMDALLEAVPGLKLVYDSANMYPVGETAVPYFRHFSNRTAHVHIKDVQISESQPEGFANPGTDGRFYINAPHGTGVVDFDALIDTIRKSGYDDTLAIEYVPIPGADPAEDMKRVYDMFSEKI